MTLKPQPRYHPWDIIREQSKYSIFAATRDATNRFVPMNISVALCSRIEKLFRKKYNP